jgi:hypothetical protein
MDIFWYAAVTVLLVLIAKLTTVYMFWASVAYAIMITAWQWRHRNRLVHVWLMGSAMAIDLTLVLLLEFGRSAIATALSFELGMWQELHVASSALAVVLYIPVVIFGITRLRGRGGASVAVWHLRFGSAALILRSIGFFLMFSLLKESAL